MFGNDISIDLGTATVQVYIKNKGIVLREPTVIAVNTETDSVCGVGEDALKMVGRTPPHIHAVHPLIDGVISNFTLTREMIRLFLKKSLSFTVGHPRIMMCVPSGITDVEQRAVIESAREAGARDIYIIEEPVAAALGAGFDISRAHGTMVIDIGGGTTDIAVLSLGGVVAGRSLKIAGDEFNDTIIRYMKKEKGLLIGPRTAENIKREIGCVIRREKELLYTAKGLGVSSGLPQSMIISSDELYPIFDDFVFNICERVREVLEDTPPELHGDIIDDGIIMTGGGSLIYGLCERITEASGVKCSVAQSPVDCVALGAGRALEAIDSAVDPTHIYHKKAYIRD